MRSLILVATLLATGCGGSTLSDQIADFRATASSLSSLVDSHASSATAAAQTSCTAEMADYAHKAGALIDRMMSMSSGMDRCMSSMGRPDRADLVTGCAAMRSELDAHVKGGCSAANVPDELARHATAMKERTSHELERMGEMSGMSGGMMNGGSMKDGMQGCN